MISRTIAAAALGAALCTPAAAFDRQTTAALHACHDYLWSVPEFDGLPNAAISVFPRGLDGNVVTVSWTVDWTDPTVRAAGTCSVADGEVIGYETWTS